MDYNELKEVKEKILEFEEKNTDKKVYDSLEDMVKEMGLDIKKL